MPRHKISIEQSISNINRIVAQFSEIISLVADDAFIARIKELSDRIEYCNPSTDEDISNLDRRISNSLGDLKIQLTTRQARKFIDFKMESISALIAERISRS